MQYEYEYEAKICQQILAPPPPFWESQDFGHAWYVQSSPFDQPHGREVSTASNHDTFAHPGPRWGVGTGRWWKEGGLLPIQGLLPPGLLLPKDVTDIFNNQIC